MVTTNTSNINISSDYHITSDQEFSVTQNSSGNGYTVTSNVETIIIDKNTFVAAAGGYGGTQSHYAGFDGGSAITLNFGATVTNFYNYGYLVGGGGGGGAAQDQYASGGNGGIGGGGGGGGGAGTNSGTSGGDYHNNTNSTSSLLATGGGSYSYSGGNNSSYTGGSGNSYGGGGGCSTSANGNSVTLSTISGAAGADGSSGGGGGAGGGNGGYAGSSGIGGGGGGSGGGKGGIGAPEGYNGGNGGFGINCLYQGGTTYRIINLYNYQTYQKPCAGIYNMGPLYITGYVPQNYYIYIDYVGQYGQLFVGPSSVLYFNRINNFKIDPACYDEIKSYFGTQTSISFNNVIYNNGATNDGYQNNNIVLENYPTETSPYTFRHNGSIYSYYLSSGETTTNSGINLTITKTDITSTTYGNNIISTSTLGINGNLCIHPYYSNTIVAIQMGIAQGNSTSESSVTFSKTFPSGTIIVQLTPYYSGLNYFNGYNLNNPQLKTIETSYFTWVPFFYDIYGGVQPAGSYTISWIAICYN